MPRPQARNRRATLFGLVARWGWLCLILGGWAATTGLGAAAAASARPNVILLVADDLRGDALRVTGNRDIRTPHLDRLARSGWQLTRASIQGGIIPAVCAPSRASLLSGRSMFRFPPEELHRLTQDVPLLPAVFRAAGYRDYAVGKWHNGGVWLQRAFSDGGPLFMGGMGHHASLPVQAYDPSGRFPASRAHPLTQHSSEAFADAAIEFLRRPSDGRPFFLYVAFTAPHDPRESPPGYREHFQPGRLRVPANFLPQHPFDNGEMTVRDEQLLPWPRTRAAVREAWRDYDAMIEHLDDQVGRILAALRATGHEQDTIVVFVSDNGLALGSHGLLGKQSCYEHSLRVPLFIQGPGVGSRRKSDALVNLMDLFPTLCEWAGVPVPVGLDGKSFLGVLQGRRQEHRPALLGAYGTVQRSVRENRWKLIRYPALNRTQLFDLRRDPEERFDRAHEPAQAGRIQTMLEELASLQKANGDALPLSTNRPASGDWHPPVPNAGASLQP